MVGSHGRSREAAGFAAALVLLAGLTTSAPAVAEPVAAPDFALKAYDGRNHRLSEQRGEVVALLFWGSWCGGCRRELERLERQLGQTFGFDLQSTSHRRNGRV